MRTLIVASLLASIALPAAASADAGPWSRVRQQSSETSTSRSSDDRSAQRSFPRAREAREERQREAPQVRRDTARDTEVQRSGTPRGFLARRDRQDAAPTAPVVEQQQQSVQTQRSWRERNRTRDTATTAPTGTFDRRLREARRDTQATRPTNNSPVMSRVFRETRRDMTVRDRWNSDWRNDRRYDWRRYRDYNRSLFYLGSYYDPFGYGYNRFQIGWSLWPSYYGQNYWINDPWQYRLPPAYGPYRWVRYWDDALLVNVYTGEVVDVLYSFFW